MKNHGFSRFPKRSWKICVSKLSSRRARKARAVTTQGTQVRGYGDNSFRILAGQISLYHCLPRCFEYLLVHLTKCFSHFLVIEKYLRVFWSLWLLRAVLYEVKAKTKGPEDPEKEAQREAEAKKMKGGNARRVDF